MTWPLSQDYNEAIQNPRDAFADPELRGGAPAVNALGIPLPRSGNFADVYEISCPATGNRWAVKCFTREVPGLRERYAEVGKHLAEARLPFAVEFQYLEQGIRVLGRWYPALKMRWVEGLLLNEFVRGALDRPPVLDALGKVVARMARRLREAGLAHADLQHGNVILVPGRDAGSLAVKLIDYDGMFVPALAGSRSGEVGHPAYQHPQRLRDGTYNAEVDRFPLLLISCAIRSLRAGGRALWERYDTGDNLLFREADLGRPGDSALFRELRQFPDADVQRLAGHLALAALGPLELVPLLDDVLADGTVVPLSAAYEEQVTGLLGPGARVGRLVTSSATAPPPGPETTALAFEAPPARLARRPAAARVPTRALLTWGLGLAVAAAAAVVVLGVAAGLILAVTVGRGHHSGRAPNALAQADRQNTPPEEPVPSPVVPTPPDTAPSTPPPMRPPEVKPEPRPAPTTPERPKPEPPPAATPRPEPPMAMAAPVPRPKHREPFAVEQGEAENTVKRLKKEFARLEGADLAAKLEDKARASKDDATLRFVLLREAWQTAARAADAALSLALIDQTAEEYDVNALALKSEALATAADWAKAVPELNRGVAEAALATVDEAVAADDYEAAQKVLTLGEKAARKARVPALTARLAARRREVSAASQEQTAALTADNVLNNNPDDPKHNAISGKYLCFRQGDWDTGLRRLARCSDPVLRDLAKDDLARPRGAGKQVELGDHWWELAESRPGLGTTHVQRRACWWYEQGFPGVPEPVQDRIDSRIKQVREAAPNLRPPGAGAERARLTGHTGRVTGVACSQDGRLVLSGGADGTVRLWAPAKGQDGEQLLTGAGELRGVALSPDGRHAAAAGPEGVWRWDLEGGKEPIRLARTPAVSLQMAADGRRVVAAGAHGPLETWSMEDGELLGQGSSPSWGVIRWAALVPGQEVIAFVAEDGASVRLWDLREKKERDPDRPVRYRLTMTTAALTPDGRAVAAAGERQAQLLDLKTGQVGMAFRGHMGKVTCIAISPDGRFLLTGSEDRTVRLWDVRTGCELRRFTGHTDAVTCVAFAPDGRLALSGSDDQTVRLWELPGTPAGP